MTISGKRKRGRLKTGNLFRLADIASFLFLPSSEGVQTDAKRDGDFIEGLHREIIGGLVALYLADEIMGKANGLGKLGRGHAPFLAVKADIFPYSVIDVRVKTEICHISYHLTKVYPLWGAKYVR